MLERLLSNIDKFDKVFSAFKLNLVLGVIVNLIIIAVLFKLTDVFMLKIYEKCKNNPNMGPIHNVLLIINRMIKFLIVFVLVASFLQSQGYSLTSLIAGFGITGLAVGFAAQQTIASVFGTFAILTDKVYKMGDYIKVNDTEGIVENINLRSTKIRTRDHYLVTIPNDKMADSVIANISEANKRRIDLTFAVTYDTSDEKLQRAMDIIKEHIESRDDMHKDIIVFIDELAESSVNIRLLAYAKTKVYDTFIKTRSSIYYEIVKLFRKEGIDFAFPTTTVYLEQ